MILTKLPLRLPDSHGSGDWLAPRGWRKHYGRDYDVSPRAVVYAPVDGVVTFHGWPYANSELRYIEIKSEGHYHRLFYVKPSIGLHEPTEQHTTPIGFAQDIGTKNEGQPPHIHYEIRRQWVRGEVIPDYAAKRRFNGVNWLYFDPERFNRLPITRIA